MGRSTFSLSASIHSLDDWSGDNAFSTSSLSFLLLVNEMMAGVCQELLYLSVLYVFFLFVFRFSIALVPVFFFFYTIVRILLVVVVWQLMTPAVSFVRG